MNQLPPIDQNILTQVGELSKKTTLYVNANIAKVRDGMLILILQQQQEILEKLERLENNFTLHLMTTLPPEQEQIPQFGVINRDGSITDTTPAMGETGFETVQLRGIPKPDPSVFRTSDGQLDRSAYMRALNEWKNGGGKE